LVRRMKEYDRDNISPAIIAQMEPFALDPDYTPDIINQASEACKAMCMWTLAMYKYYQVTLIVGPKKIELAKATGELEETMGVLHVKQAALKETEDKIAALEAAFSAANTQKEELKNKVEQCEARLERAGKLMDGLGGNKIRCVYSAR
jgi:dynein heavy chain